MHRMKSLMSTVLVLEQKKENALHD